MENWTAILGLTITIALAIIASAVRHGQLQQRVIQAERAIATLEEWKQSIGVPIAQIAQLHQDFSNLDRRLTSINVVLTEMRVLLARMEGHHEAQRDRPSIPTRRDTLPP